MDYDYIINILNQLYSLDKMFKDNLIVAGGIAVYIATNTKSNRLHGDIDLICSINNIDEIRNIIKKANLYDAKGDSKLHLDNDYGFHFMMEGIKIGIYPYFIKDALYQHSYDSFAKIGKTKKLNIDLKDYINENSPYKTMALEVILKSKLLAFRDKDKLDIDLICSHGFNSKIYSKIVIQDI